MCEKRVKWGGMGYFSPFFLYTWKIFFFLKKLKVFTINVSYKPILNYKNISKIDKSELNYHSLDASRRNVTP